MSDAAVVLAVSEFKQQLSDSDYVLGTCTVFPVLRLQTLKLFKYIRQLQWYLGDNMFDSYNVWFQLPCY